MNFKHSSLALVASFSLLAGGAAQAGGSLDLSISNKSFMATYGATSARSPVHFDLSFLHHEDRGELATAGLHVVDTPKNGKKLYIGVGGKLHAAHLKAWDSIDTGALAIGGFARYSLPYNFAVAGSLYYAPSVLSFSETERLIHADLRGQFNLIPNARIFAGYRYIGLKLEQTQKTFELSKGFHAGLTIDF